MRVRALVGVVFANDRYYTTNDEFDIEDTRGQELVELGALERLDQPKKRGPGRPRKTDTADD